MFHKENLKLVAVMSVFSISVLILFLIIGGTKPEQNQSTVQNFKYFVTNMIKEQSSKIQMLLKKIQTNAQSVLEKIENIKQDSKTNRKMLDIIRMKNEVSQVESPLKNEVTETTDQITESRSFNSHYGATGYGVSGNANYGPPTYHHHSIGFDPINIVVSMSLLSFLLQALQGLLTRSRFPTPVVEAKSLSAIEDWTKSFDDKIGKDNYYYKKKYLKKYFK